MMRVAVLLVAEDTLGIYFLHFDAAGTMYDTLAVDEDAHMGYTSVFMIKECQVTCVRVAKVLNGFALRHLLGRIAQQALTEQAEEHLRKTGAVHAQGVLAAP